MKTELAIKIDSQGGAVALEPSLARKAAMLRASTQWMANATDIQRGRAALLEVFAQQDNLPLSTFARRAKKSRQQICKDLAARQLLTLRVGSSGLKLPDWQLDPVKRQLTVVVLQRSADIDDWTLYRALSEPLEGLAGRSPIRAVTAASIQEIATFVFNVLGVHYGYGGSR